MHKNENSAYLDQKISKVLDVQIRSTLTTQIMAHHDEVPEWDPEFLEFKKTLEVDVKATFHSFRSHIDQLTSVTQVILML